MTQFSERLAFVQPRIESVLNASTEITASKGLRCLLELVLALGTTPYVRIDFRTKEKPPLTDSGNYMNRGPRGNAHAFRLQSLLKIGDTKSSRHKEYTLLHYVVHLVDTQVKTCLRCRFHRLRRQSLCF